MNDHAQPPRDRLTELLADRALFGLDDSEQRELEELLAQEELLVEEVDSESLERTLASAQLALLGLVETMPAALAEKIATTGRQTIATSAPPHGSVTPVQKVERMPRRELFAWFSAAAAIAVAFFALNRGPKSAAALRAELLNEPSEVTQVAWTAGSDPTGQDATGNVVWHNDRQQGVMQFKNLAANDPSESQYQLWIFDSAQDEKYPIDGGVFNVPAGDEEVLVKINAKLPVVEPTLFAITVEKPGGVVVSSRERLPLLAKVEP